MKAKNITYWTTTGLVAFFIGGGGLAQLWQYRANPHGVVPVLGYPNTSLPSWDFGKCWERSPSSRRVFRASKNGRMPAFSSTSPARPCPAPLSTATALTAFTSSPRS